MTITSVVKEKKIVNKTEN